MQSVLVRLVIDLSLLLPCAAVANNNLFLPGDAFFPTELSANVAKSLKVPSKEPREFIYSSLGGYSGAFCGYAGFNRVRIPSVNQAFAENLAKAYETIRKRQGRLLREVNELGKIRWVEENAVPVLFYPRGFEIEKRGLGLRYNEDWLEEVVKFGHPAKFPHRLCCLVDHRDAIEEEWRGSKQVPALKAKFPEFEPTGRMLNEVAEISEPVKAIVLLEGGPTKYFQPENGPLSLYVIDEAGITLWTGANQEWEQSEFKSE